MDLSFIWTSCGLPSYGRYEGAPSTVITSPIGMGQFGLYFCHLCVSSSYGQIENKMCSCKFVSVGRGGKIHNSFSGES